MKTAAFILLFYALASACDPERFCFSEAKDSFDLIFTGRVIAAREKMYEIGPSLISTFEIETVWKGNPALKKVDIETSLWGCSQTRFNVTARHLIFANSRGKSWTTSGHDQQNRQLLKYDSTESLELMALSDWFRGTDYFTSEEFTPAEIDHLAKGLITKEDKREYNHWRKTLPEDSVTALVEKRDAKIRESLNYPENGKTLFILNDTLMTRRDYFFKRTGNSAFRLYKIPEEFVKEMELRTDHIIVAHSSYNLYSSPDPVPLLSSEELKLLLLDKIADYHSEAKQ